MEECGHLIQWVHHDLRSQIRHHLMHQLGHDLLHPRHPIVRSMTVGPCGRSQSHVFSY